MIRMHGFLFDWSLKFEKWIWKEFLKKENIFPSPLSPFSLQAQPARLSLPLSFCKESDAR
jgi:hypothetical protein